MKDMHSVLKKEDQLLNLRRKDDEGPLYVRGLKDKWILARVGGEDGKHILEEHNCLCRHAAVAKSLVPMKI